MTTTTASPVVEDPEEVTGELAGRLFEAGLGAFELVTVALGDRLGLYRALAGHGPATAAEMGATARVDARYAREWCEQQAAAGLVAVDDPGRAPEDRRYALRPGSEAVLLDPESPAYLIPLGGFLEAVGRVLPALETAFRTGGGVPYADYAVQHAQGGFNRPAFTGLLVQDWMPHLPDLDAQLRAGGALQTARRLTGDGAAPVVVMDERAAETFTAPADPIQRFLYAASVLHCLPVGRCEEHSAGTGTVMRPATLARYAREAGFGEVTVLPIEHDMFRFYRLDG